MWKPLPQGGGGSAMSRNPPVSEGGGSSDGSAGDSIVTAGLSSREAWLHGAVTEGGNSWAGRPAHVAAGATAGRGTPKADEAGESEVLVRWEGCPGVVSESRLSVGPGVLGVCRFSPSGGPCARSWPEGMAGVEAVVPVVGTWPV